MLFVFLVGSFQGQAQTTNDPLELLRGLDRLTINPAEIYVIRGAQITRDRVNFYFDRGLIGFLTPINGEVTGAVFAGDGEVLLMPADAAERRSLAQFTNSPILEEQFTSAYLRFTDQTARELLTLVRRPEPEDFEFPESFAPQWNPLVERLNPSYSPRILVDLLGEREMPCFETWLQGKSLGAFQVLIDERFPEAVRVGKVGQSDGREYADVWCSLASKRSEARLADLLIGPAQVLAYKIETRIGADNNLEGRAELLLESRSAADRVLVFELARLLKVSEVREEAGSLLPLLQNPSLTESEAATPGDGWVFVILPAPHPVGTRFRLTFVYQGNVITDEGNGVLYVGQRGSWYPRRGFNSNATYDLTFQYPERLTLVATGECLEEKTSGGMKHSHWVSAQPVPVAGFNLGPYQSRGRKAGGVEIEVFAAREVEAALEKPHFELQPSNEISNNRPRGQTPLIAVAPAPAPPLDPAARLDGVTEVGATALEFFQSLWGRFPYPRLSVSQIPGDFGQGWPGLVYLPTLAFLPDSARARLGLNKPEDVYNEIALAHEIAHQWWGNQVGWQSYHDQWLSEGFATYAAALYLASEKDGKRKFEALLQDYKATLLSKNPQGATIESGGPVWLGHRLSNSLNPNGYANIIYKKACWVIHMLRCLMSDGKTGSKERFFTMLRDFLETYRGQFPSTKDFVRHAEKYMSPVMDIEHDGRLDWFFNDWVFGTGIPTYELDTSTRRISAKKFVVEGTIKQSGVPSDFEMPVPLIASYGKERSARLGWVVVSADGASFRFTTAEKPSRAAIDENSILAVVK
ncbi:MAG: hypothetical protein LAN62_09275 [Acidobacteriia bacterium]|nr:hypothetical protein [Terriglobia bacterium]